ncbi:unnamed protein product [Prunus armeniaca]
MEKLAGAPFWRLGVAVGTTCPLPHPHHLPNSCKLKQPSPTQSEIRQIDRVRLKVPAVERVYPQFLFTANLVEAKLANPAEIAEARRMNESSKRRLMMGLQGKKAKRQAEAVPVPSAGVDSEDQTLADRLRQLNARTASAGPTPSPPRLKVPRVTLAPEDDENLAEPITSACPSKVVQFANHMILGSQMEHPRSRSYC